jgi:acyl carrier protein
VIDIYAELTEIMIDIFNDDDIKLTPETTAADVENWDSLNNIRLMAQIESEFQMRSTTFELTGLKNVGELVAILKERSPRV